MLCSQSSFFYLKWEVGERGEKYVIVQFSLLLLIVIRIAPVVRDALVSIRGPLLILAGLVLVYRSAADINNSLNPYPNK